MSSGLDKHTSLEKQTHQLTTEFVHYRSVMFLQYRPLEVTESDKRSSLLQYGFIKAFKLLTVQAPQGVYGFFKVYFETCGK